MVILCRAPHITGLGLTIASALGWASAPAGSFWPPFSLFLVRFYLREDPTDEEHRRAGEVAECMPGMFSALCWILSNPKIYKIKDGTHIP